MHEVAAARDALIEAKADLIESNSAEAITAAYRAEIVYWTLVSELNPVAVRQEIHSYLAALKSRFGSPSI